jgi:hypothetical protein
MLIISRTPQTRDKTGSLATLAQAKKQLHIESDFTEDDDYIEELIEVATETVEQDINSDILDTENELTVTTTYQSLVQVQQSPLRLFSKLEYHDGSDWKTVESTEYTIETYFHYFEVEINTTFTCEKLRFTFKTGYTASTYPAQLRHACLLRITDLFDTERQGYKAAHIVENKAYAQLISKHVRKYW